MPGPPGVQNGVSPSTREVHGVNRMPPATISR